MVIWVIMMIIRFIMMNSNVMLCDGLVLSSGVSVCDSLLLVCINGLNMYLVRNGDSIMFNGMKSVEIIWWKVNICFCMFLGMLCC